MKGPWPGNEKDNDDASCHSSQPDAPTNVHSVARKPSITLDTATFPPEAWGLYEGQSSPPALSSLLIVWEPNPLFSAQTDLPPGAWRVQSFPSTDGGFRSMAP